MALSFVAGVALLLRVCMGVRVRTCECERVSVSVSVPQLLFLFLLPVVSNEENSRVVVYNIIYIYLYRGVRTSVW